MDLTWFFLNIILFNRKNTHRFTLLNDGYQSSKSKSTIFKSYTKLKSMAIEKLTLILLNIIFISSKKWSHEENLNPSPLAFGCIRLWEDLLIVQTGFYPTVIHRVELFYARKIYQDNCGRKFLFNEFKERWN